MSNDHDAPVPPLEDFVATAIATDFASLGTGDVSAYVTVVLQNVATSDRIAKARSAAHMLSPVDCPRQWTPLQQVVRDAAYDYAVAQFSAEGLDLVEDRTSAYADVIALAVTFAVERLAERAAVAGTHSAWTPWADLPVRQRLARERAEEARRRQWIYCPWGQ